MLDSGIRFRTQEGQAVYDEMIKYFSTVESTVNSDIEKWASNGSLGIVELVHMRMNLQRELFNMRVEVLSRATLIDRAYFVADKQIGPDDRIGGMIC